MHDIGPEAHVLSDGKRGAGEQGEAEGVVAVVLIRTLRRPVEPGTLTEQWMLDEIDRDRGSAAVQLALVHRDLEARVADRHRELAQAPRQPVLGGVDRPVAGGDHQRPGLTRPKERSRQRAQHISEPTGLGKRRYFRGNMEDVHPLTP